MLTVFRTGIPLSTYFSAIKLRWMIDHHPEVHEAHETDDLMFGTVDTWLVYVSISLEPDSTKTMLTCSPSLVALKAVCTSSTLPTHHEPFLSRSKHSNGILLYSDSLVSNRLSYQRLSLPPRFTARSTRIPIHPSPVFPSQASSVINKPLLSVTSVCPEEKRKTPMVPEVSSCSILARSWSGARMG